MKKRLEGFPFLLNVMLIIVALFALTVLIITQLSNFNIINIAPPDWLFPLSVVAVNLFGAAWIAVMVRITKKEQKKENQIKKNYSFYIIVSIVMALGAIPYMVKLFNILM